MLQVGQMLVKGIIYNNDINYIDKMTNLLLASKKSSLIWGITQVTQSSSIALTFCCAECSLVTLLRSYLHLPVPALEVNGSEPSLTC